MTQSKTLPPHRCPDRQVLPGRSHLYSDLLHPGAAAHWQRHSLLQHSGGAVRFEGKPIPGSVRPGSGHRRPGGDAAGGCGGARLCQRSFRQYPAYLFQNEAEQDLFQRLRRSPYRNYTAKRLRLTGDSERVIYLMVLTPDGQIPALVGRLSDAFGSTVRIVTAPATEYPGYTYLKLYHRDARKANMLEILKERTGVDKVITFGSIPGEYDVFVHDDGGNSAVKAFKRLYEGRPVKS